MTVRIMLVDDDELIRMGLKMILESEFDFDIVGEAANGAEALVMIRGLKPDVILMDIQMPVMDGIEATRRIKEQNPGDAAPRVLVLTTFGQNEYVTRAIQAGASGFLLKRMPADELIASIKDAAQPIISPNNQ